MKKYLAFLLLSLSVFTAACSTSAVESPLSASRAEVASSLLASGIDSEVLFDSETVDGLRLYRAKTHPNVDITLIGTIDEGEKLERASVIAYDITNLDEEASLALAYALDALPKALLSDADQFEVWINNEFAAHNASGSGHGVYEATFDKMSVTLAISSDTGTLFLTFD